MTAAPIVKALGGKTRLLPELVARMPKSFGRYFEPFLGGGALFFHIAARRPIVNSCLNDANVDLMRMYRAVANDVEAVIERLEMHRAAHAEYGHAHYYAVRTRWNNREFSWTNTERAAAYIYLNKTCFNGLWRVNQRGAFNAAMGAYRNPAICDADGLRAASVELTCADLITGDYHDALAFTRPGDFVYLDPPYDPITDTANFTSYTPSGFNAVEQAGLACQVRALAAAGIQVMVSNSDTPRVRELYAGLQIYAVSAPRSISCNGATRKPVGEVIITAGYER